MIQTSSSVIQEVTTLESSSPDITTKEIDFDNNVWQNFFPVERSVVTFRQAKMAMKFIILFYVSLPQSDEEGVYFVSLLKLSTILFQNLRGVSTSINNVFLV